MHKVHTLSNGLRIVTAELPHTRSATVSVYVGAGSRYERDPEAGLSHFLEHMLFKGASRRPTAQEISEAIENAGGSHNAATDREVTVYYAKVPDVATLETLDILADMVSEPVMDPAELEKERYVILEELAGIEDSPEEIVSILADETLWPGQPLGRNIGGTTESVESITSDEVNRYFRRQHLPNNMVISVAGNINADEVVEQADRWFGSIPAGEPGAWFPATEAGPASQLAIREKDTEQAHICLSYPTLSLSHPDRFVVDMLSTMLGEGMSSRLFLSLREEKALVYDVHSYPSEYRDAGSLTVYAGCDPERARETVEAALAEIESLLATVTEAELTKARNMGRGRIQLRMEDTRSVAGWNGSQELLLGEIMTVDEVVERLNAVTLDEIREVGRRYLHPSRAVLTAVGPFDGSAPFDGLL